MSFSHQIAVELVNSSLNVEEQPNLTSQPGDYSIDIQAADGWVITGQYKNNVLQAITVQKTAAASN